MIVTAWLLLVFFGTFTLHGSLKFLFSRLNTFHALCWFFSAIVTAVSAGVIWGGLFQ